jgi:hypothetical protein
MRYMASIRERGKHIKCWNRTLNSQVVNTLPPRLSPCSQQQGADAHADENARTPSFPPFL